MLQILMQLNVTLGEKHIEDDQCCQLPVLVCLTMMTNGGTRICVESWLKRQCGAIKGRIVTVTTSGLLTLSTRRLPTEASPALNLKYHTCSVFKIQDRGGSDSIGISKIILTLEECLVKFTTVHQPGSLQGANWAQYQA